MFDAATIVAHVGDLLLQARNFCIGLIQHTLTRMQRVTRAVVLTAQFFEHSFQHFITFFKNTCPPPAAMPDNRASDRAKYTVPGL